MTLSSLIGNLAATMTTAAFIPQVIRVIRTGDTNAISLWMYIMFCTGLSLWLLYGLMLSLIPLILANGLTLFLALIVLSYKIRNLRRQRSVS